MAKASKPSAKKAPGENGGKPSVKKSAKTASASSVPPRARKTAPTPRKPRAKGLTCATAPAPEIPVVTVRRGRPKDSPDVWTPEHIAEVADLLWSYVDSTEYPTEAEFCYLHGVRYQRLVEFEELREAKEYLFAKRQANVFKRGMSLEKGDGPLSSFIKQVAANAGPFSLTEKTEITEKTPQGTLLDALEEAERLREKNKGTR